MLISHILHLINSCTIQLQCNVDYNKISFNYIKIAGVKSPAECKKRWGYLRDNYIKAKKSMKSYVRSGANAEEGRPVKSGFRFYDRMQFLETIMQSGP